MIKKYTLLLCTLFTSYFVFSQKPVTINNSPAIVITCSDFHITKPLSELSKEHPYQSKPDKWEQYKESKDRENRSPQTFEHTAAENPILYGNDPTSIQTEMGTNTNTSKAPIKNWPGQTASGFRPMDPSGAAGPNHYIQAINGTPFRIFNKTTGANMLTANIGTLWSPATPNDGDPIILYDKYADRWLISQFGTSGNKIYIAISKTADPMGAYYTYSFTSPEFPDYLKFGIWENGYYMTSNQATDKVFCFERDQMLIGNASARAISKTFTTGATSGFFVPLPADAEGGLPAAGTPCPFFSYSDNGWGGGAVDGVKIWDMTVTWGTTPAATITLKATVPTAAFDAQYNASWNDVSQPSTTQKLDGIGGVPTYRAQWRKWTGYNSVVMNWGVYLSSTQRSIKWVELRQNQITGIWSLYQEGTYTPDAHTRWLGSIAMDNNGSIALCYAKSSTSVYPSLCYTGRLATDPLGTMSFAETVAAAGTGSETSGNRFGDYSQTSLDPDGLTFWHTGEYTLSTGTTTRVYSFQLPMPATSTPPVADFVASTTTPCIGSTVTFTDLSTNTPTGWAWTFSPTTVIYVGGTSATSQNPQVQFNAAGPYTVALTATNAYGNNTNTKTSYITPLSGAALPLVENFEGTTFPPTGWTINNPDSPSIVWGTAGAKGLEKRAALGNTGSTGGSVGLDCFNYSDTNQVDDLITIPLSLVGTSSPKLTFKRAYKTYVSTSNPQFYRDELKVYISADCGATWGSAVYFKKGAQLATNGTLNTSFTPSATADWDIDTVNLTAYIGQTIKVKFSFGNRYGNTLYLDDININSAASVASVAITSSDANNIICAGSSVTFTATPTNGGTTPSYQWKVNGVNAGTNSPTFTTSTLTTGQIVTCVMTSTLVGVSGSPATSNAITTTVNAIPTTPVVTTNSPVCSGSSINLTTPTVSGATYAWTGVNSYTNSTQNPTITGATSINAGAYNLIVTVAGCSSVAGTSTVVINSTVIPSVVNAITAGGNPTCASQSVTFTASPTNGGTTPTYQWQVNGVNAATGVSYTPATIANGAIITCIMTTNVTCPSTATATSNAITMVVTTFVTPAVVITASANPSCTGSTVTYTAAPTNGGTTPTYQWKVNGTNVGTGTTYSSSTLVTGNIVTCVMTSSSPCAVPTTATSNAITVSISAIVVPSVSIALTTGTNPACSGITQTFTATPTNGGTTPTYQWKVNGTNVGTGATYSSSTLATGSIITCVMTSSSLCASPTTATSNAITMVITTSVTPSVTIAITAGSNPDCPGTTQTFTAYAVNGGTSPAYQWKVNGTSVGTGTTYTSSTLSNLDVVSCVLTSNATCATTTTVTSNSITMSLVGTIVPAIAISTTTASACTGTAITFNSVISNGGTSPVYSWKVNGTSVGTGTTYTSSTLSNLDVVTCVLTSNASCLTTPTANSNGITISISSPVTPAISIAVSTGSNPACQGANVGFTASATNGGTSPLYQWQVNGANVGINSSTYSSTALNNGDVVVCVLISNAGCLTTSGATSSPTTMTVNPIPATPTITSSGGMILTSSSPTGNQWYLNGGIIAGATSQNYTATSNGNYTVIVTGAGCPSLSSANFLESSAGLYDVVNVGSHFIIYPNPSSGKFTVVFTSTELLKYKIELHNSIGQIVYFEEIKDFNGAYSKDFDITEYGKGEYFLRITDSKKNQMEKVIIY